MPLSPSTSLHFESWDGLLRWLPKASEGQLVTVFVWAGELSGRGADAPRVARVRKEAFEHLVGRTRVRLGRFLIQRCGCRDTYLADDIVQQVLIKLFLRADQFDPGRSFWGWLYRIARNEYIDALRRLHPGDVGVGQSGRPEDELEHWLDGRAASRHTPEDSAMERESRRRLDEAIDALPTLQRDIVRLKRDGLKGKDIAAQLGISQAYVSQLYHEAGEILREAVER